MTVSTPHGHSTPYDERILPDGRRVAFKVVRREHELRCVPGGGAACDETVLVLETLGFAGVGLRRLSTGQELWAPFNRWRQGQEIDFGYGRQVALSWDEMLPLPGSAAQLSLFEGGGAA